VYATADAIEHTPITTTAIPATLVRYTPIKSASPPNSSEMGSAPRTISRTLRAGNLYDGPKSKRATFFR